MPKSKYELIYKDLKDKIDRKEYKEGIFLPPENTLVQQYDCSRNTIRRAISHLVMEGLCTAASRKRRARHTDSPTATAKV